MVIFVNDNNLCKGVAQNVLTRVRSCSGSAFAWNNFKAPPLCTNKGWLLAGGLNPENVGRAISILRPDAVDVASGIAGTDGIKKDPSRVFAFMEAVRAASGSARVNV
jgi:phosphoribosylanthranilate isomerase